MIASGQAELFAECWEICEDNPSTVRVIFTIHRHGEDYEVATVNIPRERYERQRAEALAKERERLLVH
jgi:hypothetical protein